MEIEFQVPHYELKIPSSGQSITVRPFLVREEKMLLIAAQSKDLQEVIATTKQVIKNCVIEPEDFNVDKLPFFDVDYLYIALRAKSVSETVDVHYTCHNMVEKQATEGEVITQSCGAEFSTKLDIANVAVIADEKISRFIKLTPTLSLTMRYPTYHVMKTIEDSPTIIDKKISLIGSCIERVHQGDKVFSSKDYSPMELKSFLEGLTREAFSKLEEFVDNLPTFVVTGEATCPSCGYKHNLRYDDFENFFL